MTKPKSTGPYNNPSLDRKLRKAKEWMGAKYVYHKDYVFNPKHRWEKP